MQLIPRAFCRNCVARFSILCFINCCLPYDSTYGLVCTFDMFSSLSFLYQITTTRLNTDGSYMYHIRYGEVKCCPGSNIDIRFRIKAEAVYGAHLFISVGTNSFKINKDFVT